MSNGPVFRFAPSPNGRLHLGHAYSACLNQHLAEHAGGVLLLRIEDIDIGRSRQHFIQAIFDDLDWLGVPYARNSLQQSSRFAIYEQSLKQLREMGLVYPCWATRAEIRNHIMDQAGGLNAWPRDPDGGYVYPNLYKELKPRERQALMWENRDYAWRIDIDALQSMAEEKNSGPIFFTESDALAPASKTETRVDARPFGDIIIARKDIPTSYHLSVVLDDAHQNITHVVRGQDLRAATHIHRLLQMVLGLPAPIYTHHALLQAMEGRRLSKTAGDSSFRALELAGVTAQDIRRHLPPPMGDGRYEDLLV
jgi:glutamyl-Q tRNA(Asp) synthetase